MRLIKDKALSANGSDEMQLALLLHVHGDSLIPPHGVGTE